MIQTSTYQLIVDWVLGCILSGMLHSVCLWIKFRSQSICLLNHKICRKYWTSVQHSLFLLVIQDGFSSQMGSLESESGCWVSVVWHAKCMPLEPSILGTHWRKFETLVLVTGIIWQSDDYPYSVCLPTESYLKSHKYVLSQPGLKNLIWHIP